MYSDILFEIPDKNGEVVLNHINFSHKPLLMGLTTVLTAVFLMPAAIAEEKLRGAPLGAKKKSDVRGAPLGGAPKLDVQEKPEPEEKKNPYDFERTLDGEHLKVNFGSLGNYEYNVPYPEEIREAKNPMDVIGDQIPKEIKGLDKQKVVAVGYMMPIDVDRKGRIKSFALVEDLASCCYGIPPAMNEWIMVEMKEGEFAGYYNDIPTAVFGEIEVGEEIEDGYIMSLYRMEASEVMDVRSLVRRAEEKMKL